MKTWLKPVLCAGILAGGSIAINDMNVQAKRKAIIYQQPRHLKLKMWIQNQ
ncbi:MULTISPECIES: hypothetical protein [Bacillus cereus group]|uniref:hypothetical protein n=1 Tax=Bacillus cereus group TaxID=86661 RepID=UPI0013E0AAC6|nr:hypothetical protein [Bacillus thuringiensis]